MKAFCGICTLDYSPIQLDLLARLGSQLGTYKISESRQRSIGIVWREPCTGETSPTVQQCDNLLICWSGYLSASAVQRAQIEESSQVSSDTNLLLYWYKKWSYDGLARLSGEFALTIWDPDDKGLILARDISGAQPLYYLRSAEWIAWATELSCLAQLVDLRVDEEFVADYLVGKLVSERTPFVGISAVRPGESVTARLSSLRRTRLWNIPYTAVSALKKDGDYEARYRELFIDAVADRVQSKTPVFAELSGGLDSSAIVCTAAHGIRTRRITTKHPIHTVSYVYPRCFTSDESRYIAAVEARTSSVPHHISASEVFDLKPTSVELRNSVESRSWRAFRNC